MQNLSIKIKNLFWSGSRRRSATAPLLAKTEGLDDWLRQSSVLEQLPQLTGVVILSVTDKINLLQLIYSN